MPSAGVVVSRLVANSSLKAGTAMDLSVAWNADALRLTVADHGLPPLPGRRPPDPDIQARLLTVAIAGLARTFGVLPTADGGKVVWAVLDAPRQRRSTRKAMPDSKPEPEPEPEPEPAKSANIIRLPHTAWEVLAGK